MKHQHNGYPRQLSVSGNASRTKIVDKLLQLIETEDWVTFKTLSKHSVVDEMLKKVWAK